MISVQGYTAELLARKASIDGTLASLNQLNLFVAQKEAELRWIEATIQEAEKTDLTVTEEDKAKYAQLIALLKEELLALHTRRKNTEALSEALQESFTVRLATLFHIDVANERWEIDFEKQRLRRIGEDACCTEDIKT